MDNLVKTLWKYIELGPVNKHPGALFNTITISENTYRHISKIRRYRTSKNDIFSNRDST